MCRHRVVTVGHILPWTCFVLYLAIRMPFSLSMIYCSILHHPDALSRTPRISLASAFKESCAQEPFLGLTEAIMYLTLTTGS